jgi:hypothetical protein
MQWNCDLLLLRVDQLAGSWETVARDGCGWLCRFGPAVALEIIQKDARLGIKQWITAETMAVYKM